MISVLINAYAISPDWGSEQGMGWNWMISIARHCRVYVITEGEWKDDIERALLSLPQKDNIHIFYIPVQARVRKMCWNQGDYRFYLHYAAWQRKALALARRIVRECHIDVIHQLNMVGFREPGLLWKIKGIPYVWGPFAGSSIVNMEFLADTDTVTKIRYRLKNMVNRIQFRYSYKVISALKHADIAITPISEIAESVQERFGNKVVVIPETGLKTGCVSVSEINRTDDGPLNLLWAGRFIDTKKLDIALRTMAELPEGEKVILHIVGFGQRDEEQRYKQMAEEYGINGKCVWYGKVANSKVHEMMLSMDALFFTSIFEVTSTVVPEAIQARLPVICHDCCGFGPLIDDHVGRKIPMVSPARSVKDFAGIITYLASHKEELKAMSGNFDNLASRLTYESKAKQMADIYTSICNKRCQSTST